MALPEQDLPVLSDSPQPQPSSFPSSIPSVPPPQVDFSPLISYFDTQFAELNNKVSSIDNKIESVKQDIHNRFDTITSDIDNFKTEVKLKFTEVQDMIDQVEASAATSRTKASTLLQNIFDYLHNQTSSLISVVNTAGSTLQDIRDNTDRVCLDHNIPSLQALLDERFAALRAEFFTQQPPQPSPSPPPSQPKPQFFKRKHAKKSQPDPGSPSKSSSRKHPPSPDSL